MANADQAAGAAVTSLDVARMIGPTVLDLLIGGLNGETPADYCTGGGTYDNTLTPAGPVAAGSVYSVTFSNCVVNPGPDSTTLNGSATMTFDSVTGSVTGDPYAVDTRINIPGFSFADSVGTKYLVGELRYTRSATVGLMQKTDTAESLSGKTLTLM